MPNYEIGITEINTQVRRLGYVSAILSVLGNKTLSETLLYYRVQKWSQEHEYDLRNYVNSQGQIRPTRMKTSVKNYTEFVLALGLIGKIAGAYRITRFGRILIPYLTKDPSTNAFNLNLAERLMYLYFLLVKDSDRLLTVINLLIGKSGQRLSLLQNNFQEQYMSFLDARMSTEGEKIAREILSLRNNISRDWKNSKRYAENIIPPRVNWLLDLGLVHIGEFPTKLVSLTPSGNDMWKELLTISDSNLVYVNQEWVRKNFFTCMRKVFTEENGRVWEALDTEEKDECLSTSIDQAFNLLRSSSAPKISLQPALIYICLMLATVKDIWIDISTLQSELENRAKRSNAFFDVRFSYRENESYLIIKPI